MEDNCKKNLLICGANGFLGSAAVRYFSTEWRVLRLERQACNFSEEAIRFSHFSEDISRNGVPDAVVFCNTCYGKNNETASEVAVTNIIFGLDLLQKCAENKIFNFVNINTILPKELNAYSLSKNQFAEWGNFYAFNKQMNFIDLHCEHFYGPNGSSKNFVTYLIKEMKNNTPELKLTAGLQKRDFIYIEDVLSALKTILSHLNRFQGYCSISLGSGNAITVRELCLLIHSMTNSKTTLMFGAVPYRQNEVMNSNLDISFMRQLGWSPRFNLHDGLKLTIQGTK